MPKFFLIELYFQQDYQEESRTFKKVPEAMERKQGR